MDTTKPSGKSLMKKLRQYQVGGWCVGGGRNESGHGAVVLGELKQVWAGPGQPELWLRFVAVKHNGCLCGLATLALKQSKLKDVFFI